VFTEIELKYRVKEFDSVRKKLRDAGAELIREAAEERNTVLDLPDGSLRRGGTLLRIREFGKEVILTVKEPGVHSSMKTRIEHEAVLSVSFHEAAELFTALGYREVFHYEKTREIWSAGGHIHVCLDTLFFGLFVEIEADTQLKVRNTALILGFNPERGSAGSYRDLQLSAGSGNSRLQGLHPDS
jgi:adenylate cyclase class 2